MSEKKRITISGILQDLEDGLTRPLIAEKYDLSAKDMKLLFSNEQLKGKKSKRVFEASFELIDDTVQEEQVSEEAPEADLFK